MSNGRKRNRSTKEERCKDYLDIPGVSVFMELDQEHTRCGLEVLKSQWNWVSKRHNIA